MLNRKTQASDSPAGTNAANLEKGSRTPSNPLRVFVFSLIVLTFVLSTFSTAFGQEANSSNSNSDQTASSPSPTPVPQNTPVPAGDVAAFSETTSAKIEEIDEALTKWKESLQVIEGELPATVRRIDSELSETTNALRSSPTLASLRSLDERWRSLLDKTTEWRRAVKDLIDRSDKRLTEVNDLIDIWTKTLSSLDGSGDLARDDTNGGGRGQTPEPGPGVSAEAQRTPDFTGVPPVLIQEIRGTIDSLEQAKKRINDQRASLLGFQNRLVKEGTRINGAQTLIEKSRQAVLASLLVRESPPIWSAGRRSGSPRELLGEVADSLRKQAGEVWTFSVENSQKYLVHCVFILLLATGFNWAGRRAKKRSDEGSGPTGSFPVFESPVYSAIILSLIFLDWIYPLAPPLLRLMIGVGALVPVIVFLRRILDKTVYPVLTVVGVLFIADSIREVTSLLPLLTRVLLLAEVAGAIVFVIWFLRRARNETPAAGTENILPVNIVAPVLLALFGVSLVANVLGYVRIATLLANGVLRSIYLAIFFYAAVRLVEMVLDIALSSRFLSFLNMVRSNRQLVYAQIIRVMKWFAAFSWAWQTLLAFSISSTVYLAVNNILSTKLEYGKTALTPWDLVLLVFAIVASLIISRIVCFVFEQELYPRIGFAPGVSYALSAAIHYTLLAAGILLGVSSLGLEMSQFTVIVGAMGVGLGFGLRNLVNDVVSGFILLVQRPVEVNDSLQIGENTGVLKSIGIRSSVLRTFEGSELIVPNGNLVSEEITNWTRSDENRRFEFNVGVAYGTSSRRVKDLLMEVALSFDHILKDPAPNVLFVGFGESSLDFRIQAWAERARDWAQVRSELGLLVHDRLSEEGIEIPFPQRDVHIRNETNEEEGAGLAPKKARKVPKNLSDRGE